MTYSLAQSVEATRVTSGSTVSKKFTSNVTTGNLLVAVISRTCASGAPQSVGQVADDQGNHWKQAVEFATPLYGADIWYCESAVATGTAPTVTATQVGYPMNATTGMNMEILEYSGCSGYELVDQIAQATVSTTSVTATSNHNLSANHELAISVVSGNMTGATVPTSWTSRLADTTQKFWIADELDTGTSAGSTVAAAWTGLTGATAGVAILVTFVQTGVSASSPRLVQSCYTDIAIGGPLTLTKTSQPFPVNPTPGNTLLCLAVAAVYTGKIVSFPVHNITDTAGNKWHWLGESGPDPVSGVDLCLWVCPSAVGGATTLTATMLQPSEAMAFYLMEFANFPGAVVVDSQARSTNTGGTSLTTAASVQAGDLAFMWRSYIYFSSTFPAAPAAGWKMICSDTSGAGNAMVQLATSSGSLTGAFGGAGGGGGDMLLVALRPAPNIGVH